MMSPETLFGRKTPNPKVALPVSGVNGRFVKIQLNGNGALALAEIIVK